MDNLFFLEAKCKKCGKVFYPRYDLGADDYWVLTYGQKELPASQKAVASGGPGFIISKMRTGPQYKCPWCGNASFVHCGNCGKITCNERDSENFTCSYCGYSGKIAGTITGDDMKGIVKSSGSGQ